MLQTQVLRVGQVDEPCIELTQENSVQDCLPYMLRFHGPHELLLAYPKLPCVCLKVNIC